MEQNVKISGTQVAMLLFIFVTSTLVIYVPAITAKDAKESAWLAASILPFAFGYLTLWVVFKLGSYFPTLTIFQYTEIIIGKFLGKGLAISYIIFLIVMDTLVLREFSDFLNMTTLPLTPRIWLLTSIIVLSTYGAYQGLEVIIRAVQFIMGIYLLGFISAIILGLSNFEVGKLLPFMEEGLLPIIRGSIVPSSWYGEICILAILFPFVNKPKEIKRKGIMALVAITLFVTIDVAVTIGVLGSTLTSSFAVPLWSMARSIDLGEVLQRLESYLLVFWITGVVIKATLLSYLICLGVTQVFGFKNTKIVLGITAGLELFITDVVLGNATQMHVILTNFWPPFGMVFELAIPGFLLGIAKLRKKHRTT